MFKEIQSDSEWNRFIADHGPVSGSFLQSVEWGDFQRSSGKEIKRFLWKDKAIQSLVQCVKHHLPLGFSYWYIPRGPIADSNDYEDSVQKLISSGLLSDADWIRIDPPILQNENLDVGRSAFHTQQPPKTIALDLTKSEDDLLAEMHQKTRYNIRLATKKGVEIKLDEKDSEIFWKLAKGTAERDGFNLHSEKYYKKMLNVSGDISIKLATARYEGAPIAAAIYLDFGTVRTYLHGASDYTHRSLMAPYLLQWSLIESAKSQGFLHYDFWGIAPTDKKSERLAGVTRFKRGFGGEELHYKHTIDIPLRAWKYRAYKALYKLKHVLPK